MGEEMYTDRGRETDIWMEKCRRADSETGIWMEKCRQTV